MGSLFFQVKWWAPGGLLVFFEVKWWVPCVYPSKMVGPLYFPSKMGSSEERALMKFKWFFAGTFWGPHCYSKNSAANRDLKGSL